LKDHPNAKETCVHEKVFSNPCSSRRPRRRLQGKSCAEACTELVEVTAQGAACDHLNAKGALPCGSIKKRQAGYLKNSIKLFKSTGL